MVTMNFKISHAGFSIVELIVAIGILMALLAGATYLIVGSYTPFVGKGNTRELERYAQEAAEILQVISERSWTEISNVDDGSNVKLSQNSSGDWVLSAGTEVRGVFTRAITISTVQRNSSDVIVASGGTDDPTTKKVIITISASGRSDYKLETYLINWEAYRMTQTDWSGSYNTALWTSGTTNFNTSTNMDLPTTSGDLGLSKATST